MQLRNFLYLIGILSHTEKLEKLERRPFMMFEADADDFDDSRSESSLTSSRSHSRRGSPQLTRGAPLYSRVNKLVASLSSTTVALIHRILHHTHNAKYLTLSQVIHKKM